MAQVTHSHEVKTPYAPNFKWPKAWGPPHQDGARSSSIGSSAISINSAGGTSKSTSKTGVEGQFPEMPEMSENFKMRFQTLTDEQKAELLSRMRSAPSSSDIENARNAYPQHQFQ